jgi:hypothetical protein
MLQCREAEAAQFMVTSDVRHRASEAFWAMYVEALNWNGMGLLPMPPRCNCRRIRCANGVTDWTLATS